MPQRMEIKVKTYIVIGATAYACFLGWWFKSGNSIHAASNPSYAHSQEVGACTSVAASAPQAEQVFDAKLQVKMKKSARTRRRRSIARSNSERKLASGMAYFKSPRNYHITPVGGALHSVSQAEFRSFGAWGLMGTPTQHNPRRNAPEQQQGATFALPMYPMLNYPQQDNTSHTENLPIVSPISVSSSTFH